MVLVWLHMVLVWLQLGLISNAMGKLFTVVSSAFQILRRRYDDEGDLPTLPGCAILDKCQIIMMELISMEFDEVVNERKSIRGYKPDPVPREIIDDVITSAKKAPNSINTQTWKLYVITGEPLQKIKDQNTENMLNGVKPQRDIKMREGYQGIHRKRQIAIAVQLFDAMGIAWEDRVARGEWAMQGFKQFGAPVSIVLTYDKYLDPGAMSHYDLGAISYGLCLAAWQRGLGTVINSQGSMQSDVVREHANIPESENILFCVAMGYPDWDKEANSIKSPRVGNEEFVSYVGFED